MLAIWSACTVGEENEAFRIQRRRDCPWFLNGTHTKQGEVELAVTLLILSSSRVTSVGLAG